MPWTAKGVPVMPTDASGVDVTDRLTCFTPGGMTRSSSHAASVPNKADNFYIERWNTQEILQTQGTIAFVNK